ncbi:MAG: uracil-DNA glycosylase [Candidatus Pacebacteria bacterium]|nr:uracil-DNA glycosylase [Candidatus Paceibacterota bacterium]
MTGSENVHVPDEWKRLIAHEFDKPYFTELAEKVREEYLARSVFPPPQQVFRAFELCEPQDVRVVILGQDPYHTPGVADGLAFSTHSENRVPPSLQNIFKEIESEYHKDCNKDPNLTRWEKQGVLLLNASLSVRSGEANSHAEYGWHTFTDAVISALSENYEHIVFLLWGAFAGQKQWLIDGTKHLVLTSPHPSPLSAHRGFFGNNHFTLSNEYLKKYGRGKIDWCS